jgi:cysteine-S-conjugate beta-lyase
LAVWKDARVDVTRAHDMAVLRRRTSEKWRTYPEDVLPLFVAEMDYPLAPSIRTALSRAIENGDSGYVDVEELPARTAFAGYARHAWGWSPSPERMGITTDVSVVIVESLRRLISGGDGVIITPPVYPPFFELVPEAGGTVVEVPLADDGERFALDLGGIDRALAEGAKGVLLCSPHNPVGLVHTAEQLRELSSIVDRHGGFVVSDEIHAPLTFAGHRFTPYLTVSDAAREHGLAATSASKAFNLAGLKCGFFVAESDRMTSLIRSLPQEVTSRTGLFGVLATCAGLTDGRAWLAATIAAIEANVALLRDQLAQQLPSARLRPPAASYLAWVDLSAYGWGHDPAAYLLDTAKVALSSGPAFGSPGAGYARVNVACAPEVLVEAIDRIAAVV